MEESQDEIVLTREMLWKLTAAQRKLVEAVHVHPEGILSSQLAELGVSNKSGTMASGKKNGDEILADYDLILLRNKKRGRENLWKLERLSAQPQKDVLPEPETEAETFWDSRFKVGDDVWYFITPPNKPFGININDVKLHKAVITEGWQLFHKDMVHCYTSYLDAMGAYAKQGLELMSHEHR